MSLAPSHSLSQEVSRVPSHSPLTRGEPCALPLPTHSTPAHYRSVLHKPKHIKLTVHVHSQTVSSLLAFFSHFIVLCLYGTLLLQHKLGQDLPNLYRERGATDVECTCVHWRTQTFCRSTIACFSSFARLKSSPEHSATICMQHTQHRKSEVTSLPLTATSFCR